METDLLNSDETIQMLLKSSIETLQNGQLEQSLIGLKEILRLDQKNIHANNAVGMVLMFMQKNDEALSYISKAYEFDPHNQTVVLNLCELLCRVNNRRWAARICANYLIDHPGDQKVRTFADSLKGKFESVKIVSDKYRFIWVGIPNVSTRIFQDILLLNDDVDLQSISYQEELLTLLNNNYEYQQYFKFAFVRNPWARAVFCYRSIIENPVKSEISKIVKMYPGLEANITFEEFVDFLLSDFDGVDDGANEYWMSQHKFITDSSQGALVDYVGKLENATADFQKIRNRLNLPSIDLSLNNSLKGSYHNSENIKKLNQDYYRSRYTVRTIDMVRERYQEDIKLFDYKF